MHHVLEWYPLVQLIVRISRTIIGLRIFICKMKSFVFISFVSREKIWEIVCERRADRVIVTHGTDTIIQTGNFLDGIKKIGKMCGKSNTDKPSQLLQKKFGIQIEKIYQSS